MRRANPYKLVLMLVVIIVGVIGMILPKSNIQSAASLSAISVSKESPVDTITTETFPTMQGLEK